MTNILVVGSINMDIVNNVEKHPLPGETIKSFGTTYSPGGKGANQAIAAQLAGGQVSMIGAVGTDPLGKKLLSNLRDFGVEKTFIISQEGTSGIAFITIDQQGENNIIISEGANGKLTVEAVQKFLSHPAFATLNTILLQNEIPWETTNYVIQYAHQEGIRVMFNPAPAIKLPPEVLSMVDCLIVNETEAAAITGQHVRHQDQARIVAKRLINQGVQEVILTLGGKGSFYLDQDGKEIYTPAYKVKVVDTTAAGDAFIGAFATARQTSMPLHDCLRFATAAAALTISKPGAQMSLPKYEEIKAWLHQKEAVL